MNARTLPTTKALSKNVDTAMSNLRTNVRKLPRVLRRASKTMRSVGSDALTYAKQRPARVVAGLVLLGLALRKFARRA